MSAQGARGTTRSLQRSGFYALYSFVPFKIIRSHRDQYVLLLARVSGFKVYPDSPKWSKGIYDEFNIRIKYSGQEIIKRVRVPMELKTYLLSSESGTKFIYLRYNRNMQSAIINISDHIEALAQARVFDERRPVYIEFTYRSLTQPHVCRLGYVLLSSSEKCPLENVCSRVRIVNGSCKYYISVDNTYVGLYYVYPLIVKQFDVLKKEYVNNIIVIPFNGLPLIKVKFTEQGEVRGGINSVVLTPKMSWLFYMPRFYLYPLPTIGIRLKNVHVLIFEFNTKLLRDVLLDILKSNHTISKWIILKYIYGREVLGDRGRKIVDGFKGLFKLGMDYSEIAREDSSACRNMITNLMESFKDMFANEDFINFASFVLVHTLAHLLVTVISALYHMPEESLLYHIEHPIIYGEDKLIGPVRLILFEDAIGGYGYLKNISTLLKNGKMDIITDIIEKSLEIIKNDKELSIEDLRGNMFSILHDLNNNIKDKIARRIENIIKCMKESGIYPHIMAFRKSSIGDIDLSNIDERSRNILESIFSNTPLCWDGCPHCVMLERGCMFSPYDQIFVVSKRLIKEFLEKIQNNVKKPYFSTYLTKIDEKIIIDMMENAEKDIMISSAYLSVTTIEFLAQILHKRPNISVRILTSKENLDNPKILEKIKEILNKDKYGAIQVRFYENLHAKGILIDDLILIKGSFNFTKKGLGINVENIDIVYHPLEISSFKKSFNKLWEEARQI